jgi:translation initiation factor 3 subunit C
LVHRLAVALYQHGTDRLRTRALLCHAYHHALHGRFHQARDLLLMSHLQETINLADVGTKVLYNRTMVQLGLAAFRMGACEPACNSKHVTGCRRGVCVG